jgi:hypothetical protein
MSCGIEIARPSPPDARRGAAGYCSSLIRFCKADAINSLTSPRVTSFQRFINLKTAKARP